MNKTTIFELEVRRDASVASVATLGWVRPMVPNTFPTVTSARVEAKSRRKRFPQNKYRVVRVTTTITRRAV